MIERIDYRVVATSKTSTMQKELNDAAEMGFRFDTVMGVRRLSRARKS